MCPRRALLSLTVVLMLCWIGSVRADRITVQGVELTTPDEGWNLQMRGAICNLVHETKGAVIELFRVGQVPAAETESFAKWLRGLKTKHPAGMEITKAWAHEQHGLTGVMAEGTAKGDGGKPVRLRIVVLPAEGNAVLARAIIHEENAETLQKEAEEILETMKPK